MLVGFAVTVFVAVVILGGMLAFGTGKAPPPLASISDPFRSADFSGLPPLQNLTARDGAKLAYRVLPARSGAPERIVILVHGGTASSSSMHPFARALSGEGMTVYTVDMRGHGDSGRRGDIDYPSQLDDDLADLIAFIKAQHPTTPLALAGFSAGGGFSLHIAGTPLGKSFERIVLLSPMLGYRVPTAKPVDKPLVTVFVPRIIAIMLFNGLGIHAFDHLQTLAFGDLGRPELTPNYSYRLMRGFGTRDFEADIRNAGAPLAVVIGADDEFFAAERFAPTLDALRPGIPVTILPGIAHIPMILEPSAATATTRVLRGQG